MRHGSGNEFNPLWRTVEGASDDGGDTPRPVSVRTRPTPEYPGGKVETGWEIIDTIMHNGRLSYVVVKAALGYEGSLLRRIIPVDELDSLQQEIESSLHPQHREAGHIMVGQFGSADTGHEVPAVFRSTDECKSVAVDYLRESEISGRLQQLAQKALGFIEGNEYDFLLITNATADAMVRLQADSPLSADEAVQLEQLIQRLRDVNQAVWKPQAAADKERTEIIKLLHDLL